ncbi:hypothetical protein F4680DRAFT_460693 [Xylaria scruposa]|nr:hypothetical protein F4680DRAFT_460693 [Xylaria scruposa]
MELPDLEKLLVDQWKNNLRCCCESLERDDLNQVTCFSSWDDLQKQMVNGQHHQESASLQPAMMKMKAFIDNWTYLFDTKFNTSVFWGLLRLVVKLIQADTIAAHRVTRMLRELGHRIELLNHYFADSQTLLPQLRETCIDSALSLLSFLVKVIEFMRSQTIGLSAEGDWQPLESDFSSTIQVMDGYLLRVEKLSNLVERPARHDDDGVSGPSESTSLLRRLSELGEPARLPCVILPDIRTSRFFDRTNFIAKIEDHFNQANSTGAFQSLALYGLGGVGKSTIALRYAEAKLRRGELDALFWVYSEKLVSIRQSFTTIATRLKLPDARQGDHDENHALVLNWLQHTQCRWLIVYDNAEDKDLIRDHWPIANRGQALITSRSNSFAFEPADGGLEITTWDTETGSRFLLHLLSTEIGTELRGDETASAHELSEKLSGHALAISHMAGLIHRRAWSISEFMKIYKQHPGELHGISGNRSINALWDLSFRSLDEHARSILGLLCFLAPDSIPQALFEPLDDSGLPDTLSFFTDTLAFSAAIENLLTLALIKRDKESRTFSLHRLVQMSFKYFLGSAKRQSSFNDATILVSQAFPRRDSNVAQLYLMWDKCSLYLQHVLSLKDCFREEMKTNSNFTVLPTYCDLNNACQRYLLEINAYTDLEDLIEINTMALETLNLENRTIALQGSLTSHRGQLLVRLGKPQAGVNWLRRSYDIRSHDVPFNDRESAWAAENLANGIATLNQFPEAIEWYERARNHWQTWSNQQAVGTGEWPACIKKSMGMALVWSGDPVRARSVAKMALDQIESTEPYNWAMAAYTHFALGSIDRHDKMLEAAEAHFMEAQNLWLKGDHLRTDPFNAACMYRLGCTALDQGKVEASVKHLRDCKAITDMRKSQMVAEHMRCLFKLSEALEQEPRDEGEAWRLRETAEKLLRQRAPDVKDSGLENTYDHLVNILWR